MNIKTFYLAGAILMIFSIIGTFWSACIVWNGLNIGGKISQVTGILFNFLWMGLFLFLYKMTPDMPNKVIESPEIDSLLKELGRKEVKQ